MPSWPVLGRNLHLPFYRARRFYRSSELGSSIAQTACMHMTVWLDKPLKVSTLSLPTCVTTVHPLQQNCDKHMTFKQRILLSLHNRCYIDISAISIYLSLYRHDCNYIDISLGSSTLRSVFMDRIEPKVSHT
jgi:hypothetical protein